MRRSVLYIVGVECVFIAIELLKQSQEVSRNNVLGVFSNDSEIV